MRTSAILRAAAALVLSVGLLLTSGQSGQAAEPAGSPGKREHLIFLQGSAQELEVFRIHGRFSGPTVMLLGGIHGDERGAYLSADHFADLSVKKGTLIVVPRANFNSVVQHRRSPNGDMNRKFSNNDSRDPDAAVVDILKSLIAESDFLITMHDGSGFYRPEYESEQANPKRYGQCIIADSDSFSHAPSGREVNLRQTAERVLEKVNPEIDTTLYKFRFFNMRTAEADSPHQEHRLSATYYALTRFGIPAFCVEVSKDLPSLDLKVRQHNLLVSAFLEQAGLELEMPGVPDHSPALGHLVVTVNDGPPLAAANGNTLLVAPGDRLEIMHISANRPSGLSAEIQGLSKPAFFLGPVTVNGPTAIIVRKDNVVVGRVGVELLPPQEVAAGPRIEGRGRISKSYTARAVGLDSLPGSALLASAEEALKSAGAPTEPTGVGPNVGPGVAVASAEGVGNPAVSEPGPDPDNSAANHGTPAPGPQPVAADEPAVSTGTQQPGSGQPAQTPNTGVVAGFLVEVDGRPVEIRPGAELPVPLGAKVKIVDLRAENGQLPPGMVVNIRGFIAQKGVNTGEDRGGVADTAELMPAFSEERKGELYAINADLGKKTLASCYLRIVRPELSPELESVTVRFGGNTVILKAWSRTAIPVGAPVELLEVTLKGGLKPFKPRYTLAGKPVSAALPQTLTMRDIAINLAVFENGVLLGKVTWTPVR